MGQIHEIMPTAQSWSIIKFLQSLQFKKFVNSLKNNHQFRQSLAESVKGINSPWTTRWSATAKVIRCKHGKRQKKNGKGSDFFKESRSTVDMLCSYNVIQLCLEFPGTDEDCGIPLSHPHKNYKCLTSAIMTLLTGTCHQQIWKLAVTAECTLLC